MEKLYDRIIWHNGTTPAINETNLNKMSKALDDIDDRIIQIAGAVLVTVPQLQAMLEHTEDIMEQIEELSQNPPYIGANGNWYVWDTSTGEYVDSGVDASITVTIADVTALAPDAQPYVTNTGTSTDPVFHLFIPRGQTGKGISSIAKTGTSGYVDTYTITYTDNTSTTYTVTNGRNTDQVTTIPTASAALVGTIYQYIGASTSSYTHGFYYECVNDGGIYKWVNIPVGNDPVEITSSDPYTFRQGLGTMADMEIVGGTVAWNQLVYANDSGTLEMGSARTGSVGTNSKSPIVSHVYYISANILADTTDYGLYFEYGKSAVLLGKGTGRKGTIYKAANNSITYIYTFIGTNEVSGASLTYENVKLFDLTLMFGSTIADAIYAMEQATAGSGIAWLKSMGFFTQDYYPYDAGSLKSVEGLQSRDVSGFNQWDEEWELGTFSGGQLINSDSRIRNKNAIPVLPNNTYYFCCPKNAYVMDVDAKTGWTQYHSRQISANSTFVTSAWAKFIWLSPIDAYGTTYNHDICINLSDPTKNGTYEPHREYSYPLDSSLTLRGIPKLDSNNKLYYDGDVYRADGSVERKYGIVDLGTLEWTHGIGIIFTAPLPGLKYQQNATLLLNAISGMYTQVSKQYFQGEGVNVDLIMRSDNSDARIYVNNTTYSDAATFKTAMSGVMLVYELATPITESAQPYQNPQRAFSDGTEGFTMTGIVPVGNHTTYQLSKALIPAEDYTDGVVRVVQRNVDGKAGKDMISDAWVSGQAYAVGDYCIYGDMIYRCIQTVTQGTAILPTNTSYWTPTKIATELETLNSRLVDDYFAIMRPNLLSGTQNWTGTYENSSGWTNDGTYTDTYGNVLSVKKYTGAWKGLYQSITLPPGIYTYSEYLKSGDAEKAEVAIWASCDSDKKQSFYKNDDLYGLRAYATATPYNSWSRYHYTFIILQQTAVKVAVEYMSAAHTLYIAGRKLEKGFYPTPWCA